MSRPSFESIYMRLAVEMSRRSTCRRLQVGCVITSSDYRYVYGIGYNGNATGLRNGCDSETPGNCGCLHAEENAVINCTASRDSAKNVFATNLPCTYCAKRLINMGGVRRVLYLYDYRIRTGLQLLEQVGIEHAQLVLDA